MRRTFNCNTILSLLLLISINSISFSQESVVRGQVKHGNEFLQAATVSLGDRTMLTDQNGEFIFWVKAGTYFITVTYAGYKKIEDSLSIKNGETLIRNYSLIASRQMEEIVVTGFHGPNTRTNLNTPVPVDVITKKGLQETGQVTLTQMLNFLAPSFNTSREILNEPSTFRGLDPQHVLILVNGIRYHNMAWLFLGNLKGQLGKGSVGNDLNSIPFPAIERIEILRDGASAQYGSDAIAGVINIILKKNTNETILTTHVGQTYKGDGEKFSVGMYHGFQLNKNGFISLSILYRRQAPTFRGGTYNGLVYLNYPNGATPNDSIIIKEQDDLLVLSRGFNRRAIIDNAGSTKLVNTGFTLNGGHHINKSSEFLWTAIVNSRKLDRAGLFRFPRETNRINLALYPDGSLPRNKSNTVDVFLIASVKGETANEWRWILNNSYGINSVRSFNTNTNNASQSLIWGANAQTSFYTGTDIFKQFVNDVNVTRRFNLLSIALGAESRFENYRSIIGEEASWKNYDPLHYAQGGIGTSGPENAVNKSRNILGSFIEIESDPGNHFLLNFAGRYEYYSDYGSNIAGKFSTRIKISKVLLLRASVNNGFRAPSLQQRYLKSISTLLVNENGVTVQKVGGLFPNTDKVVRALDIPLLSPEKTVNSSGGFTASFLKRLSLSVDAYWIQIKDRIVLSGSFERKDGNAIDAILDLNPEFNSINRISFFTNAINTKTKGIDIVLSGNWSNKNERLNITLAANFNSTRLYGIVKTSDKLSSIPQGTTTLFSTEDDTRIEKGQPGSKVILSLAYETGRIELNIRNTQFGKTMIAPLDAPAELFSSKILTDISLTYSFKPRFTITFGANNIGNVFPDRLKHYQNTSEGKWIYSPEASPFGFNGGYYFLNLAFNFFSKEKNVK